MTVRGNPNFTPKNKRTFTAKYEYTDDQIQEFIIESRNGSIEARELLLAIFGNYLSKYTTMLYHGKFSYADYDIRRFLALYVKDPSVRYPLLRNKMKNVHIKSVNEIIRGLNYMAMRYCDEIDVDQTVKMAFLQCVQVYQRKDDIPFSAYLYSYYFYILKKQVDTFMIDQLGRKTFPLITSDDANDSDDGSEEKAPGFVGPSEPGIDELLSSYHIDEYWIAGDTASFPFNILTPQDRQLIKWRWVDKDRSSVIADRITEHPNTVREHFNKIRIKLRKAIEDYDKEEAEMYD